MKYALFLGCKIPYYLEYYERSTRAVLTEVGVELVDLEFNCCGYPIRSLHLESFLLSSARSLALAEQHQLDIITPCKCCFGTIKQAMNYLTEDESMKERINTTLREEGLEWNGTNDVKHLLSALVRDVGPDRIREKIKHQFNGLKLAVHYGCHALRPSDVTKFDDPLDPTIFEELVSLTGVQCVDWSRRLGCCGGPLWRRNDELSLALMQKKVDDAKQSEADFLCVACTYCQIQFDVRQAEVVSRNGNSPGLGSILPTQLLGLSMGLDEESLGLSDLKMKSGDIRDYLD